MTWFYILTIVVKYVFNIFYSGIDKYVFYRILFLIVFYSLRILLGKLTKIYKIVCLFNR